MALSLAAGSDFSVRKRVSFWCPSSWRHLSPTHRFVSSKAIRYVDGESKLGERGGKLVRNEVAADSHKPMNVSSARFKRLPRQ
jgi:hypothetical protein